MKSPSEHAAGVTERLENVAANLQLIADLAYGDVALVLLRDDGALGVVADARPMTALAAMAATRVGRTLSRRDEPEAYAAVATGQAQRGQRRRSTRGIAYVTSALPIVVDDVVVAAVVLDVTLQATEAPGRMEREFMELADGIVRVLGHTVVRDVADATPFSTVRVAGDGVLAVDENGDVTYASPNAINIMRVAGHEQPLAGHPVRSLPAAEVTVLPALAEGCGLATEVEVGGRVLSYRTIGLDGLALVLVEDITDARRRETELKVKDATIREVHHRVKNNLQTIASLLRIQARRSGSPETSRALREAVERISSMAVVHEQLTGSDDERVEFADSARVIVEMVRSGLSGSDADITVDVEGSTGEVPAQVATSLALVTAELVHNAIEHGIGTRSTGSVHVTLRRLADEIKVVVRDDGRGLPAGFDPEGSANLGLAIVKTVVEDDLKGTLTFTTGPGTTVAIRVPVPSDDPAPVGR
jgi:two-component sensor histidine kinase/PAS domain-containing protein